MPKIRANGINLYYEKHGSGYPLVLIRGLGSNADHWYEQVRAFSSRYCVVTFDNRGIGRSDSTNSPYTINDMADDTVGLMEAIGINDAHILALSMGGMIAQEIAIRYPQKVHALILACTHCGGDQAVRPAEETARIFGQYILTGSQEAAQEAVKCLFTECTLKEAPELVVRYVEVSGRFPPSSGAMVHQFKAIQGHDTYRRLDQILAPTLVLAGNEDILVPPENSAILARRIPGARLQIIEGGAHQFLLERPDAFNRAVLEFLEDVAGQSQTTS